MTTRESAPSRALDLLLDRFEVLQDRTAVSDLAGGLTNRNLRVDTPNDIYVLRISSNDGGLLAIDRDHEFTNTSRAFDAGVGAPVIDYKPGEGLLLVGFLPGRTLGAADLQDDAIMHRVATAVHQLHAGPEFAGRFDMVAVQAYYRGIVAEHGLTIPTDYDDHLPRMRQVAEVLAATAEPLVPCNNDLLPANFLDDGEQVRIIDYEYSGMNDRDFELGNIWAEAFLPEERLPELVAAYYGRERRSRVARARLMALLSWYGWTLWAAIQQGTSDLDFDFWSWGMTKYECAQADLASPHLDRWIEEARLPD